MHIIYVDEYMRAKTEIETLKREQPLILLVDDTYKCISIFIHFSTFQVVFLVVYQQRATVRVSNLSQTIVINTM